MHTVALRTESSLYNPTASPGLVAPTQVWYDPFGFPVNVLYSDKTSSSFLFILLKEKTPIAFLFSF
jgi:hypothetical protein